jgi:ParB-like chromosome segregation protein Spo0J
VPFDKLKLPKTLPEFKLRDIINIAKKIQQGELNEPLLVNEEFMIVKGLKRYYALKYLGEKKVKVCVCCSKFPTKNNLFSIRK